MSDTFNEHILAALEALAKAVRAGTGSSDADRRRAFEHTDTAREHMRAAEGVKDGDGECA